MLLCGLTWSLCAPMRWFFRQFEKGIISKSAMEKFFRIYRSHGIGKKSHNHYSMYYNIQETLRTWSLSNIRGFPCHYCLDILHCTYLWRRVALYGHWSWLWPVQSMLVFIPATPCMLWSVSPRCFWKDSRLRLLWINIAKISKISPKSVVFLRVAKGYDLVAKHWLMETLSFRNTFFINIYNI